MILSVDSSLPLLSVALTTEERTLGAVTLEGRESRNEKLLPAIDWLLREAGVDRTLVQVFVVTRGPGSFTGVRIGLATVHGLAYALGKPVRAMSTHEAALGSSTGNVLMYSDAGRGEFYASAFDDGRETLPPSLLSREELERRRADAGCVIDLHELTRSANLSVLAAERARVLAGAGRLQDYGDMTPLYVRLAEAEVKLQREAHGR